MQEMIRGGIELVVGFTRTERLGTVLMLGVGGTLVESLADVVFRAPPLDETEADRMIDQSGAARLLEGARSGGIGERRAIRKVLLGLSRLAEANLELNAIEINPLAVLADGKKALRARCARCAGFGVTLSQPESEFSTEAVAPSPDSNTVRANQTNTTSTSVSLCSDPVCVLVLYSHSCPDPAT